MRITSQCGAQLAASKIGGIACDGTISGSGSENSVGRKSIGMRLYSMPSPTIWRCLERLLSSGILCAPLLRNRHLCRMDGEFPARSCRMTLPRIDCGRPSLPLSRVSRQENTKSMLSTGSAKAYAVERPPHQKRTQSNAFLEARSSPQKIKKENRPIISLNVSGVIFYIYCGSLTKPRLRHVSVQSGAGSRRTPPRRTLQINAAMGGYQPYP